MVDDLFFLSFERIGATEHITLPDPPVPPPAPPADLPPESDVGLRTFDELNATLSQITGVPQTNTRVAEHLHAGQAGAAVDREVRHLRSGDPSWNFASRKLNVQVRPSALTVWPDASHGFSCGGLPSYW